jgi:toxin CptA
VLLGLGAYINGACMFGAIARFGSGQWAYAATPLGFYLGSLGVDAIFSEPQHQKLPEGSAVLQAPGWLALLFVMFVAWRVGLPLWRNGLRGIAARVWSPRAATTVIGITFVLLLLLVGAWSYTDVLVELTHGMSTNVLARSALLLALLLGATWGGWTAGRLRSTRATPLQLLKCLAGGMLMGWGGLLTPGGNDGLILVGMPLLWPYAWVAFAMMCLSIGAAMWLRKPAPMAASSAA